MQENQTKGMFICIIAADTQDGKYRYHTLIQQIATSEITEVKAKMLPTPFRVYYEKGSVWAMKGENNRNTGPETIKQKGKKIWPLPGSLDRNGNWLAAYSRNLEWLSRWASKKETEFRPQKTAS